MSLSRCASRTPPGPTFLSFSDSIRSTQHVEETCSTVLLPAANPLRSRVRTACVSAAPAFSNRPRCAGSLSFSTACCVAGQVGSAFRSTTRLCGCYGHRADLDALFRVRVCSRIACVQHIRWPIARQYFLRISFSGCAYRSSSVQGPVIHYADNRYPHPQARSLSRG